MANRAILEHRDGRGWQVSWVGGAWELVDWVQKNLGDDWINCTILKSTLTPSEEEDYEQVRLLALKPPPPAPPVVERLPDEQPLRPSKPPPVVTKHENHPYGFEYGEERDPPHNWVTGIGDVFDWCDGDTKHLIRAAIEAEAEADWINNEEIDFSDRDRGPWLNKVVRIRRARKKIIQDRAA